MYAAIEIPDFALQCVLRREPELRECALAIVDGGLPAHVRQMTPAARDRGVAAGMTTTQALGRSPSLLFRAPGSLEAESACLLQCAETSSPWLEATGEGVVTLEWPGFAEYAETADGPEKIAHTMVSQLAQLGFAARVGMAMTPDLALLAARDAAPARYVDSASEFLAPLPLETLSADAAMCSIEVQAAREEAFRILRRWGIHTLGAFAALPRDQVVMRLGGVAAELWERAAGRAMRPLRLVRAPEIFSEAMELEHEVETLAPLLFLLRRFLEQLTRRLEATYRVAALLELRLTFREGAPHVREFRIPAPTCEVDVLFRVLSTHLEGVTAAAPIAAVALSALPARPERRQFSLFESGLRDPNKFFETLARLHALLGNDRAGTPVLENTHRTDAFHLITPRFEETLANALPAPFSGLSLQRFRPPIQARVHTENDRPVCVFSDHAFGNVTACRGPWRSSGEWWEEVRTWGCIEWDIEVGEQLYRLTRRGDAWFLDGTYD